MYVSAADNDYVGVTGTFLGLAICAMCYISQGKPLNIHSPRVSCYMCYMCYISQGKPLNIHSSRVPCYMCYMCYMALYST